MPEAPLRKYFDLPADVKTVDFVHQIDRAATADAVRKTLVDYEVTPSIQRNLRKALDNVRRGVSGRRSVFTWIHGSFGCGKSHFMNVLSLVLADELTVYEVHPVLQAERQAFQADVIGKRFFRLHVQCISRSATTLEEILFGAAVQELGRLHPDRPPPALFEAQKLFVSAGKLLEDLGDEKFFGAFPSNRAGAGKPGWGGLAGKAWGRARFEAALALPGSKEARDLAGELAKTPWLEGMASVSEFVKLGPGLQILAEHLKGLGYEGVVLFLDELVLWLSTFQDPRKLALETPKVSTLVEHGDFPPVLPYLTFAARQRDLSEMTGKFAAGRDEVVFRDQLSFWKDRFETISLEDKDLARIIEKRVLRTKSPAAKAEIDSAFDAYRRAFAADFRQLNGDQGDAEDFRRVYPFSPALVEVMVALSATLQRDRTALRELTNLLVRYLPDFELGKVVPIGDLFDVVVSGNTSDLPAIQKLYEQARRVYESDLLPHIRKKQQTNTPVRCQLLREEFDVLLGCSGCTERACRTQTRIAKTVLLQGIVPNTPALKELTASKLVYLNSGTLKSPVPNQEPAMASTLVREWAGLTPAVHAQGEANPVVRAVLDTIDVRRILDHASELFNEQRRRIQVRDMLYAKLGVARRDDAASRTVPWRERKWRVGFVYDNTRLANDNVFRPGADEDLRVIIDYPFDDVGRSPVEDEARVDEVIEGLQGDDATRGLRTVVWMPAFLNSDAEDALRDLVILDGLLGLGDNDLANRLPFVRQDDLPRVKSTLEQQKGHRRARIENALVSAYGVGRGFESELAPGLAPASHVRLLLKDASIALPAGGLFEQALESIVANALATFAPHHPEFKKTPTKARLEAVLELVEAVLESPGQHVPFDRVQQEELKSIAGAKHLDLVLVANDGASYTGGLLNQVAKNLANHKGRLSVGAVRAALDPDQQMSLSREVEDFLVLVYAKSGTKPLRLLAHGQPVAPTIGRLADDTDLVPIELPSQEAWQRALEVAALFGITEGKVLRADRVENVANAVKAHAKAMAEDTGKALEALSNWQRLVGVPRKVGETQRGEVLETLQDLVTSVGRAHGAVGVVRALGSASVRAERTTALTHLANPRAIASMLDTLTANTLRTPIEAGLGLKHDARRGAEATQILDRVRVAFERDENVVALRVALEVEGGNLLRLLTPTSADPPGGGVSDQPPADQPEQQLFAKHAATPVGSRGTVAPTVHSVRTKAEWTAVAAEADKLLGEGKRIRITLEILDEDEP